MDDLEKNAVVMTVGQLRKLYDYRISANSVASDILTGSQIWITTFDTKNGFNVVSGSSLEANFSRGNHKDLGTTVIQLAPISITDCYLLTKLRLGVRDILGQKLLSDVMPNFRINRETTSLSAIEQINLLKCTNVPYVATTLSQVRKLLRDSYFDHDTEREFSEAIGAHYTGIMGDGRTVSIQQYNSADINATKIDEPIAVLECILVLRDANIQKNITTKQDLMPKLKDMVANDKLAKDAAKAEERGEHLKSLRRARPTG
jgi:hypothetical protein